MGSVDTGQVQKAKWAVKRSPPVALEVKLLAMEALQSDLSRGEVAYSTISYVPATPFVENKCETV